MRNAVSAKQVNLIVSATFFYVEIFVSKVVWTMPYCRCPIDTARWPMLMRKLVLQLV